MDIVDPSSERVVGEVALCDASDVDRAVLAAKRAFEGYSRATVPERSALLTRLLECYEARREDLGRAISTEIGAPLDFATRIQARMGLDHIAMARAVLADHPFEERRGTTLILREPIGVCALITPWNWPANQILCKVAPALAAGCTMVLKPSELAPTSAQIIAEIIHEAGVPSGVFNLVHGSGSGVGAALCVHPDVDMVSLTGSARAGAEASRAAAATIKRVTLELGGKSADVVLLDGDLEAAVDRSVRSIASNAGQSCNAQARLLVPRAFYDAALDHALRSARDIVVGDPRDPATQMGPVANQAQFGKVQRMIQSGIDEGARLLVGGVGRPEGLVRGYYVRPTIFADVTPDMIIAREEIFGPVLVIMAYEQEDDAVRIANEPRYGLSGRVWSRDLDRARRVAGRLRTGMVHVNGASVALDAPFGGYRQSGNGREWGREGLDEYLERKSVFGGAG